MDNVYITKVQNENIKEAVYLCFGKIIEEGIRPHDTVLLKPNFLNGTPAETGVTTDIRLIKAVIEILKEKGVRNIVLAEAGFSDTETIFRKLNIYELEKYGIKVINLETAEKDSQDFHGASVLKKMVLPKPVSAADVIISMPKLKTHGQTHVSLGIKNLFGFLYSPQRQLSHIIDLDKAIVDIYAYLKTVLNKRLYSLVDAIFCLEGKLGPNIGNVVKMDLIIGGQDLINVDSACVRIMGADPRKIRHLLLCEQLGLGSLTNLTNHEIIGEPINMVARKFVMPGISPTLNKPFTKVKEALFKKLPAIRYHDRCIACGICQKGCPLACIKITCNGPLINYRKCIGCLCCVEGCPEKVLEYKRRNNLLFILIQKLYHFATHLHLRGGTG